VPDDEEDEKTKGEEDITEGAEGQAKKKCEGDDCKTTEGVETQPDLVADINKMLKKK